MRRVARLSAEYISVTEFRLSAFGRANEGQPKPTESERKNDIELDPWTNFLPSVAKLYRLLTTAQTYS